MSSSWPLSCKAGRRVVTLICALAATAPLGAVQAGVPGQILRPQQDGQAATILTADRLIRLVLQLPVSPEVAFDAWTDANQLVEWLSHWAEMTVTPEGTFEIGWEGYEGVWSGRYQTVERAQRLVFTWLPPESVFPSGAYETLVTLSFEIRDGGGTTMTLEHSGFEGAPELEAQLQAWRGYLFALRAFLLQPRVE
jgi:uncharacterized protein YndB with AHSA1/START domain